MPKRQNVRRFDSESVQGEGSWVEMSRMTVADMREANQVSSEEDFEYTLGLFETHVRAWNWVGDDGEPMAIPSEDPFALNDLTDAEFNFLVDCMRGREEELKN